MKLIVGLGNPTLQYAQTRHNAGWLSLEALRSRLGGSWQKVLKGETFEARVGTEKVIFLKPLTYMNLSGEAVGPLLRFYKLEPEDLLVIQDDLDSPFGLLRVRFGGRSGGQNGVKSITDHLGTEAFARLKLGISRPPPGWKVVDWVLSKWAESEKATLEQIVVLARDAALLWAENGLAEAQARFNSTDLRPKPPEPEKPKLEPDKREQETVLGSALPALGNSKKEVKP